MEDGIERNQFFLMKTNPLEVKNNENDLLYVYIPKNGNWEDFIITSNREKAIKLLNNNNSGGRVEIFKKNFFELYKPTHDFLYANKININTKTIN
jgi:poly-D-alanine transfer protein DltD